MDIELARTFVEIASTGSFIKAAERLHVAQTTVSARVRLLEQQLRRPLFVRNKGGATLTPAGEQFLRFAPTFVQLWQRARQQVAVPEGHRACIDDGKRSQLMAAAAGRVGEIDAALTSGYRTSCPRRRPSRSDHSCLGSMEETAIMYAPQFRPGLEINLLMEEELVLVTTDPKKAPQQVTLQYLHVEWSPGFFSTSRCQFSRQYAKPNSQSRPLRFRIISSSEGGSGYFRMRAVRPHLKSGKLHLVPAAPHFSFPVYALHSVNVDEDTIGAALSVLRAVTSVKVK